MWTEYLCYAFFNNFRKQRVQVDSAQGRTSLEAHLGPNLSNTFTTYPWDSVGLVLLKLKKTTIEAWGDYILCDILIGIMATLGGNFRHFDNFAEIHLEPLALFVISGQICSLMIESSLVRLPTCSAILEISIHKEKEKMISRNSCKDEYLQDMKTHLILIVWPRTPLAIIPIAGGRRGVWRTSGITWFSWGSMTVSKQLHTNPSPNPMTVNYWKVWVKDGLRKG